VVLAFMIMKSDHALGWVRDDLADHPPGLECWPAGLIGLIDLSVSLSVKPSRPMNITYDEAQAKLHEWTESHALLAHARGVELTMRAAAYRYGQGADDEEQWGITGLLHDADYEKWPEDHPRYIVHWLEERDEPEIAHAIAAHNRAWDVPAEAPMDKALLACDELTGFIVACCFVRPDGIATLKPSSVKKKLKDKSFAAKVSRDDIDLGLELLGADLNEHVQLVIDALRPHAEELNITGQPEEDEEAQAESS